MTSVGADSQRAVTRNMERRSASWIAAIALSVLNHYSPSVYRPAHEDWLLDVQPDFVKGLPEE